MAISILIRSYNAGKTATREEDMPKLPIRFAKRNMRFAIKFDRLTEKLQKYLSETKGIMKVSETDKN